MKTVQMTIDVDLLEDVDTAVQELGTSRSAFVRAALKMAIQRHAIMKQEARHAAGYAAHPVQPGEFDGWEEDGVPSLCAVNLDNLQTVQKQQLGALIATLSPWRMAEVEQALCFALGIDGRVGAQGRREGRS